MQNCDDGAGWLCCLLLLLPPPPPLLLSIHALYFKYIVSIFKRNIIFSVSAAAVMPAPPHCQR